MWNAIFFDIRTPLVFIFLTLTAQRYVGDISSPVVSLFILQHPGLTFQHHNTRLQTKRVAMNCLKACPALPWTASSPDLSPIEHIWDIMKRQLQPSQNIEKDKFPPF